MARVVNEKTPSPIYKRTTNRHARSKNRLYVPINYDLNISVVVPVNAKMFIAICNMLTDPQIS